MSPPRTPPAQRGPEPLPRIFPGWDAPAAVRAFVTTREGGVSTGAFGTQGGAVGGMNLGARCGDEPHAVAANRARLASLLPSPPVWLDQVHGTDVHCISDGTPTDASAPRADASVTSLSGVVLAILTADCLPVLLTNASGTAIGAAHAGWRGLSAGVLERTVEALRDRAGDSEVLAWLGPAIGPTAFEVGDEVRERFCDDDRDCADAFVAGSSPGKWMADLVRLARIRLRRIDVRRVSGSDHCTFAEPRNFYSYRRDRMCGRMASLIWLAPR